MTKAKEIGSEWRVPDVVWRMVLALLPVDPPKPKGGRPPTDRRPVLDAIFYRLRTGCQWKAIPRSLAPSSTAHDYFQRWAAAGVFFRLWHVALKTYDETVGIRWAWQALDGAMTKAPLGQAATGPNPTDRGKQGTKRSLLTDGYGIPLALTVAGANRPDMKLVADTLYNFAIARPEPTPENPQHICLDKGYAYAEVRTLLEHWGYTAHIPPKGEVFHDQQLLPGYRARRWVVERTHSWMNRFRALLIRWEKQLDNYLALLHFACAWITFRAARVFG